MQFTARAGLKKPEGPENALVTDLNDNADILSAYAVGDFLCTSVTRPGAPWQGMSIYQTDDKVRAFYDGAAWQPIGLVICTSGTRPAVPLVGQEIFETDTKAKLIWDGAAWAITSPGDFVAYVPALDTAGGALTLGGAGVNNCKWRKEPGKLARVKMHFVFAAGFVFNPGDPRITLPIDSLARPHSFSPYDGRGSVTNGAAIHIVSIVSAASAVNKVQLTLNISPTGAPSMSATSPFAFAAGHIITAEFVYEHV